jgi:hypothetical protein
VPDPASLRFFESDVRPLLAEHCLKCHGGDPQKIKGGLDLSARSGFQKGGDTGPVIDAKDPAASLLLKVVNYADDDHQMPPKKKLPQDKIDLLTQWVQMGAPWTPGAEGTTAAAAAPADDPKDYWAYKPPVRPAVPAVKNTAWVRTPVDAFILSKLEANGLHPSAAASKVALIRRATYDLTGLPPTPAEVEAFVNDPSPNAFEKVTDRLLASPHYGEQWGRHWLDLVGYADTNGYELDSDKPNAWRYRDYVVGAFNADKPYDQFLREQLAGDELPALTADSITATGYYRLGIWDNDPADPELAEYDSLDTIVATTSQVMLGMSMNCARCHNHKRDPILQEDYYKLVAFFHAIKPMTMKGPAIEVPLPGRPEGERALAVTEFGKPRETFVLGRGNPQNKLKAVQPGFPHVLAFPDPAFGPTTAGRRLTLANWITSPANPLTARVMVNRLWQYHFGRGIVPTPNDFGKLGQPPTHPELLDWLATEFVARGWDIKAMHKLLMLSSAYQMSSADDAASLAKDPQNELFWRFNMRRLTAEEIRDSVLMVNGTLNLQMGGPCVFPPMPPEVLATSSRPAQAWGKSPPDQATRRSIYVKVKRSLVYPVLATYDFADTDASTAVRFTTTVPTQALTMLNSAFANEQAERFAEKLEHDAAGDVERQVTLALAAVTQHAASSEQVARGVAFIRDLERQDHLAPHNALTAFCLLSLNLNEFVYLD